jgi:hypothetical protein
VRLPFGRGRRKFARNFGCTLPECSRTRDFRLAPQHDGDLSILQGHRIVLISSSHPTIARDGADVASYFVHNPQRFVSRRRGSLINRGNYAQMQAISQDTPKPGISAMNAKDTRPLVIDVDGTLNRSHLLVETFFAELAKRPQSMLEVLSSLFLGRAALVLLSQKVAIFDVENHVVGKIHTSARGKLRWVCQDRMTVHHGLRLMWRG